MAVSEIGVMEVVVANLLSSEDEVVVESCGSNFDNKMNENCTRIWIKSCFCLC
ncbi:MAG: hypothetical protein LBS15_01960 [Endomicrobium sp.]|nr:hypothetical protein [Endomicrobium sp.]